MNRSKLKAVELCEKAKRKRLKELKQQANPKKQSLITSSEFYELKEPLISPEEKLKRLTGAKRMYYTQADYITKTRDFDPTQES